MRASSNQAPLNLVLVHSHDTGRYIQPYGAPVACPNLMRLAREGTLFRNASCTSPGCSPSRSSLLSGQWPHTNGMIGLAHRGFKLSNPRRHLSHRLRDAGYFCHLVGMQHEVEWDDLHLLGYHETTCDLPSQSAPRAQAAADWIENSARQVLAERPFFLNVGLFDTHRPYGVPSPDEDERFSPPPPYSADSPAARRDMAELHSAVRRVDETVGTVLDAIDRAGLGASTCVVYTTDHGLALPRAKATLFEAGTGVAWIVRGGPFAPRVIVDNLVSQLDFVPTFFEAAGLGAPNEVQGRSLLPMLRGETDAQREKHEEAVFSEITFHAAHDPARAVRTPRWKYIRFFEDYPRWLWPNIDPCPSKDDLHASDPLQDRPREMLFDLAADPHEGEDLAALPRCAQVLAEMRARLDEWMEETGDPLRLGPMEAPPGAIVTPGENYNP
jgi:arylsulfatase A-like enzyme